MHTHIRNLITFLACAVILPWTPGCSYRSPGDQNILQAGNGAEVQDLDPHVVSGVTEHRVLSSLFEGLTDADAATLEPVPAVADR